MMTRPSKVLRHRQSVEIIHAGRCPEYSILGKIKFGQPGFRFETDGTWSIPETLGNYLLIGKEKFLATVQLPVFITPLYLTLGKEKFLATVQLPVFITRFI